MEAALLAESCCRGGSDERIQESLNFAYKVFADTMEWAVENLPLFDSSDKDLVSAYYYRAKTYKSHLIPTAFADIKHVVSEFGPTVPWGGASCCA